MSATNRPISSFVNVAPSALMQFAMYDSSRTIGDRNVRASLSQVVTAINAINLDGVIVREVRVSEGGVTNDGTDQSAKLAAIENALWVTLGLTTKGRGKIIFDCAAWISSPFRVRELIHVDGFGWGTGLFKRDDFTGNGALVCVAITGAQFVGLTQDISNIEIDGRRVGVGRGSCASITKNQGDTVPLSNVSTTNGWVPQVGDLIENDALPYPTFITAVTGVPGNYTLTLSDRADYDNYHPTDTTLNRPLLQFHRGVAGRSATHTLGSYNLAFADITGLVVGMRLAGTKVAGNTRIEQITPGAGTTGTVRISKLPTGAGAGALGIWHESAGLIVEYAEITALPAFDDELKYARVECNNISVHENAGDGVTVCGGRTGFHFVQSRSVSNFGSGLDLTSSDSYLKFHEIGENFRNNIKYVGATPRIIAGETYSNNNSRWPSIDITADEITLFGGEMTGTIRLNSTTETPNNLIPGGNIVLMNQKLSKDMVHPDPEFPMAYIRVRGIMRAMVTQGTMKGELAIRFLVYFEDSTATAEIRNLVLETKLGNPLCLFTEAISNNPESVQLCVTDPTTGNVTFGRYWSGMAARGDGTAIKAGLIGSRLSATRSRVQGLALVNATAAVLRSITLTPGVWTLTASGIVQGDTAATGSRAQFCLTTGTTISDDIAEAYWSQKQAFSAISGFIMGGHTGEIQIATAVNLVVNLVGHCNFTAGTVSAYGGLSATCIG